MADFKVVISDPKTRKTFQKDVEQHASHLIGKKIGEKVPGNVFGLNGYELQVTGGSDKQGFPMRSDIEGISRKKALLAVGTGIHPARKGMRKRKSIRGNTVSAEIVQVNTKVVTYGSESLEKLLGKTGEKKEESEDKKEQKAKEPAETKKK
jgi:small subunit ribosomal protein S6e